MLQAAYCDPGLIAEVVVPLLSMQQSVLLCISTILDSGNHYTKMMELVDDLGFKVFETINITLVRTTILCQNVYRSHTFCPRIVVQVCDECLKGDFPEKCECSSNLVSPLLVTLCIPRGRCRHKLASMPRWLRCLARDFTLLVVRWDHLIFLHFAQLKKS